VEEATHVWTGEALHRMASDGRLVLSAEAAAKALTSIEHTLATVHSYLHDLHQARENGPSGFTEGRLDQQVIDLYISEMAQPGRLAHLLDELAKFAAALRLVATTSPATEAAPTNRACPGSGSA